MKGLMLDFVRVSNISLYVYWLSMSFNFIKPNELGIKISVASYTLLVLYVALTFSLKTLQTAGNAILLRISKLITLFCNYCSLLWSVDFLGKSFDHACYYIHRFNVQKI